MKKYVYSETQITSMILLLNSLELKGMEQAKILAAVANVIDDAEVEELKESDKEE